MRRSLRRWAIAAGWTLVPATLSAHLVTSGLGPVYDGAWHVALTPGTALPVAGFALFTGLRGPVHARYAAFLLPPAWLAGCLAALAPAAEFPPLAAALALFVVGGLLAADAEFAPWATAIAALLLGAAFGSYSGLPSGAGIRGLPEAIGSAGAVFMLMTLLASVSLPLRRLPAIIAVRVAGSWMAAVGLLLLGWWTHRRAG